MLKVLAEKLRERFAGEETLPGFEILAEGEDGREELTDDVPLVLLETQSVTPVVQGHAAHPCRRIEAELVLSIAAAHPVAAAGPCALARATLREGLRGVLEGLKDVELTATSGRLVYSVAGWSETWGALRADGKLYEWRLPFVWVVVGG
ncbi:MAG: hypothetical protein IJN29_06800 [Akkermansia sp.]|nr:hypothetical protein [Akkermansia sp.]